MSNKTYLAAKKKWLNEGGTRVLHSDSDSTRKEEKRKERKRRIIKIKKMKYPVTEYITEYITG